MELYARIFFWLMVFSAVVNIMEIGKDGMPKEGNYNGWVSFLNVVVVVPFLVWLFGVLW